MFKLLVVDDEWFAVQGITRGIEWDEIDIHCIFEASDADEAMGVLKNEHIDVMIADIEMPGKNGLELMEWVKVNSPHTVTIFLTGHAEFSYAQKALQLGGFNYILKPVDHDQLKQLVNEAIYRVKADREMENSNEVYKKFLKRWEAHLPLMIENFWKDVLWKRISLNPERLKFLISQYKIPLTLEDEIIPVLISIEYWKEDFNARDEEVMTFAIQNAANDIFLDELCGNVVQNYNDVILVLIYNSGERQMDIAELQKLCRKKSQQFQEACESYLYSIVSCYIGQPVTIFSVGDTCNELLKIEQSNLKNTQKVIDQCEIKEIPVKIQSVHWLPDLLPLFELGKKEELLQRVKNIFADLEAAEEITREMLEEIYYGISYMFYYVSHVKGLEIYKLSGSKNMTCEDAVRSVSRLKSWVYGNVSNFLDCINNTNRQESATMEKIKQYVSDHIGEDFTREDIARYVFLNPAYLSRVFKHETGLSLSDYIVQIRMDLARQLLAESNQTISAIAESVGYVNFSHFAKMFRKIVGVTPTEFRKKYQDLDD